MNGFEAIDAIRAKLGGRQPPIIAMSADAQPEIAKQLASMKVECFLTKPFQGNTLFSSIENALASKSQPLPASH